MIPTEIQYKTHDRKVLTIVEAFNTWKHYQKDCKYKVLMLIDHNHLQYLMDTNSLSSQQVCWAQQLDWLLSGQS